MPEALKHVYNTDFYRILSDRITQVYSDFSGDAFQKAIFSPSFDKMELKERMRHTTHCLYEFLPKEYSSAIAILQPVAATCENNFAYMFFPDFVECYGMDDYDTSMEALAHFTQFSSSEFAIRPFIMKWPEKTMEQMLAWSQHPNHHVRRLASEGCRPRLPWAMALPMFKKNPKAIIPILENIKNDPSEYVRRSVANNLNDIAKDHPELVIQLTEQWLNPTTHKLLKHACRTLLKQGNKQTLKLFGFEGSLGVSCNTIQWDNTEIAIGDAAYFSCNLHTENAIDLRLEYAIDFLKANGQHHRKVFRISEKSYQSGQQVVIRKKHSFRQMTTRKHYPGKHSLHIIGNGDILISVDFTIHS